MFYVTDEFDKYIDQLNLITPDYYHNIFKDQKSDYVVKLAVFSDIVYGILIGIKDSKDNELFDILYLYVWNKYRNCGIATELINELKKILIIDNYKRIGFLVRFNRKSKELSGFKKFLLRIGMDPINLKMTEFYSSSTNFINEKWYTKKLPDDYKFELWNNITNKDKKYIQDNSSRFAEADKKVNEYYHDPFEVVNFDKSTSYVIRKKSTGNIVGWNITERNQNNMVVYRKLYITFDERNSGLIFPLISISIETCIQNSKGVCFLVQGVNRKMRLGIDIMMGHLCDRIVETYFSIKDIEQINKVNN